jgi:hypothetical protein
MPVIKHVRSYWIMLEFELLTGTSLYFWLQIQCGENRDWYYDMYTRC